MSRQESIKEVGINQCLASYHKRHRWKMQDDWALRADEKELIGTAYRCLHYCQCVNADDRSYYGTQVYRWQIVVSVSPLLSIHCRDALVASLFATHCSFDEPDTSLVCSLLSVDLTYINLESQKTQVMKSLVGGSYQEWSSHDWILTKSD